MSEKLIIKYFPENEFAKEPFYAPEDAAGLCLWGEGLYFKKQTLALVWISTWQFPKASMASFFHALVFLGVT